jgi:hypothetical protein
MFILMYMYTYVSIYIFHEKFDFFRGALPTVGKVYIYICIWIYVCIYIVYERVLMCIYVCIIYI